MQMQFYSIIQMVNSINALEKQSPFSTQIQYMRILDRLNNLFTEKSTVNCNGFLVFCRVATRIL